MRGTVLDSQTIVEGQSETQVHQGPLVSVLLVDDGSPERDAVRGVLTADPRLGVVDVASLDELRRLLTEGVGSLVVSELGAWESEPLTVLQLVRTAKPNTAVLIVTGRGDEQLAAESVRRGAADYLSKKSPGYLQRLPECVFNALKRGAPQSWAAKTTFYSRLLNALPVHIALVDENGMIRAANEAWRSYSFESHYQRARYCEGVNYLEVCDSAVEWQIKDAAAIAQGLRRVLAGQTPAYAAEYSCMLDGEQRWFKLGASPVRNEQYKGAIVAHVEITDRKQAELERDQLFEMSMSMLCIGGFDGFIKRWSPAFERSLGYSSQEIMAVPLWQFVHPDDREQAANMGREILAGQRITTAEMRIRAKDGSYKWILWDAAPCLEQKLFFATGQDITERKQIEQQLRESHQRFQLLATASKEAVWDWDLRENRLWQNDGYMQVFGTPDQAVESVVEWWHCRIHPEDRERILDALPPAIVDNQQKWVLEYRLRRLDGTYAYVYDRGFVIFDEAGEPVRMVGSIIDVTQLKTTAEKLAESEERFRLAARAARDAIWDWDLQQNTVWRSTGFETLFGYAADSIPTEQSWWSSRIHPDDHDRVLSLLPSPEHATSQQFAFEYRFRRADGSYADVFDRGFVMFGHDGKPVRMIGTIMDISERRRAEEMAQMHQAELAHISRVSTMGEIATGIAHELNQPLTAISNYAESCTQALASKSAGSEQKVLAWIDKIATNTHRAAEMIRRLRSFTRKSDPQRTEVEINELVQEVIELIEVETRRHSARLRWRACADHFVIADKIQIEQVLVNLIRNAYEAMAATDREDRLVTIAAEVQGNKLEVSVEDAGEGIEAGDLENVFEAFFTNKPNGVGIGLAISRSIVEAHGGRMWVTPNAKRGVTFRFTLPLSGV